MVSKQCSPLGDALQLQISGMQGCVGGLGLRGPLRK